jgi:hypothetical protein
MKRLKGVVINKKDGLIEVELETGRRIWTTPSFNISIREQILISWDYTHDCIKSMTTSKRLAQEETDEDRAEAETGNTTLYDDKGGGAETEEESETKTEGFSLPLVEEDEDEDEGEVEADVFSTPNGDEFEGEGGAGAVPVHRHNINSLLL